MKSNPSAFMRLLKHPIQSRMFLLTRLPNAFFAGVRVQSINENSCTTIVPYKWFTKNPFRSTYFACLSMAAEMSSGALCMAHLYKSEPQVSMLIVRIESEYYKKATGKTAFVCEDGSLIKRTIEESIRSGESKTVQTKSVGKSNDGTIIAEFFITWSFKTRNKIPSF